MFLLTLLKVLPVDWLLQDLSNDIFAIQGVGELHYFSIISFNFSWDKTSYSMKITTLLIGKTSMNHRVRI